MRQSRSQKVQKNQDNIELEDRIVIRFYTDPLCCWCWAFEPHWRTLLTNYGQRISYSYVMGGMIPKWGSYNDPLHSISTPIQMGPIWMHAGEVTNTKMKHTIWALDPPASSFPPCIAVKTVELQSQSAAEQYYFNIRNVMMEDGINISEEHRLLELASQLKREDFDFALFVEDWRKGSGKESFRQDLKTTKFHGIGRFPTLTFQDAHGHGIVLTGYRPYKILEEAFLSMTKRKESGSLQKR
jgi:putative protein-disulfide isomerase